MVQVLQRAERDMGHDAVVARAAAENCKEEIVSWRDCPLLAVRKEYVERQDVVGEETESASQLAVTARLDVTAEMDIGALACRHKQARFRQLRVELQQRITHPHGQQARDRVVFPILVRVAQIKLEDRK